MVKHHMADHDLCQPALLVVPGDERERIRLFWKNSVSHKGELTTLDPDRAADLVELSEALSKYPQYGRAVQYLRSLAGVEPRQRWPAQALGFLATGGQVQAVDKRVTQLEAAHRSFVDRIVMVVRMNLQTELDGKVVMLKAEL